MVQISSLYLILASALLAHAGIQQIDFTGVGHIYVLQSEDWGSATPKQTVGCLNENGKFVNEKTSECGTFARQSDYPYTLSSKQGNCTFQDDSQARNTDSKYGGLDYAWNCQQEHKAEIYDQLYTIDGFPYVFLCFGDVACYYDAKKVPADNEILPLWQFRWGSQQMDITPGHIMLQLMWKKIGNLPKREGEKRIPGPRIIVDEGMQVPLLGAKSKG
ncbi:hypothetical protein HBH56_176340 [Parastagonospora nodorum]|uniref:Uncharacterized protein n=2 Tax=Phaeosphaeria nodorum (strain SN15 / ATCC MYA-4574 / FGSC 10173) TaxID=321614 RepID=Q0V4A5_PHANO|nr:hypothetical protein SNOG_01159 [Parastagonospora nodorum SN15]KAH3908534.1 hypothetical protein HBH56_176340 [Parastagonospora nodorum]EAT90808.2 hypothetical protein SNOG_01159 [Parastagonospora nodorum SN15]KAH3926316.1 hypothetical protein HBH54_166820 [Parastagonospora nodorum]KAH3939093.1 hypothetical protein HBH53_240100 [Parastagonospora nodorum]KAH4133881.1 hypothetical protein HBH45_170530 [Parastagonospora nodorum]